MYKKLLILLIFSLSINFSIAQNATLHGFVLDSNNVGIPFASVLIYKTTTGVKCDKDGQFTLEIPANSIQTIEFRALNYTFRKTNFQLKEGETKEIKINLYSKFYQTKTADIIAERDRNQAGNIYLNPSQVEYFPTLSGGIEAMLKIFVSSQNELTSQYNVRGGNFDENLVYINDFEVYRPYLARSGQQEGLSIINPDLVKNVSFSTGGFQAKYGDKMSSVLDITYKTPKRFAGSVSASLLGIGMHLEGTNKNHRLQYLVGLRQKSNQYLLQSLPSQGVYNPSFTDFQALLKYQISEKIDLELLGNYAKNKFNYLPTFLSQGFGTFNESYKLNVYYDGSEVDQFDSRFAGISSTYKVSSKTQLKLLLSAYKTNEIEAYDINGQYNIGEVDNDPSSANYGNIKYSLGGGEIHNFARNSLNINVQNFKFKGYTELKNHFFQYGFNVSKTSIQDKMMQWERRDSAGYSVPFDNRIPLFYYAINATNQLNYIIPSIYFQDNIVLGNKSSSSLNYGVRATYESINKEFLISPRIQYAYKILNKKNKRDYLIRAAVGLYQQPNFYREMREPNGTLNPALLAQKSFHSVLGFDNNFKMWGRSFKYTSELYYKNMWDIIPYEYDNIRIRYFGQNNSKAYAYGLENRLYGEIVKDAESWVSINFMKTAENLTNDAYVNENGQTINPGYIPRPTDSRVNFGLFYQDYLATNKNIKVHMNALYSTGLPTGPNNYQRYADTLRLPSYKRIDIGFSALLLDKNRKVKPYYSLFNQLESIWLSLEVYNLLGIRNTISYLWLQDFNFGRTYAIPNQLTSRLLNLKMIVKF